MSRQSAQRVISSSAKQDVIAGGADEVEGIAALRHRQGVSAGAGRIALRADVEGTGRRRRIGQARIQADGVIVECQLVSVGVKQAQIGVEARVGGRIHCNIVSIATRQRDPEPVLIARKINHGALCHAGDQRRRRTCGP